MAALVPNNNLQALFFPWLLQNEFFFHHKPEESSNGQLTKNSAPTVGHFFHRKNSTFVTKPIPSNSRELLITTIQSLHNLSTIVHNVPSKICHMFNTSISKCTRRCRGEGGRVLMNTRLPSGSLVFSFSIEMYTSMFFLSILGTFYLIGI